MNLPKISVVTPSLNQAAFIERTIVSVLEQDYSNLEYIIIDGGSTDGTLRVIKRYERYLAYWISEPDDGQPQAINKGFRRCTGDLVAWQNSDDISFSNSIFAGSVFFGMDTFIGPVYFAGGLAEGGHSALYLFIGRPQ